MYRKLLIGYLDPDRGRDAIALAAALADHDGAELLAAHVTPVHGYFADMDAIVERERSERADIARDLAEVAPGFTGSARVLAGPSAAGALYRLAEEEGADVVVLDSTHRGRLGRAVFGATAQELLHGSPCAVAVAPHGYGHAREIRTIGVGYDDEPAARAALAAAAELAREHAARLRVVSVVRPAFDYVPAIAGPPLRLTESPVAFESSVAPMQRRLDAALDTLPDGIVREGVVLAGVPEDELRDEAARSCDLLVVGSRGYGHVASALLGSTSRELVRDCAAPVLVIPLACDGD